MQTETLLKSYSAMPEKFKLPEMQAVNLTRTVEHFDTHQALYGMIETFRPTQGWLCFQSAVRYVDVDVDQPLFLPSAPDGILLNAEFVNVSGDSMQVRQTGASWATTSYSSVQGTNKNLAKKETAEYLVDRVDYRAADKEYGVVCYQRLWQQREVVGIAPVAARFIGFRASGIVTQQSNGASA